MGKFIQHASEECVTTIIRSHDLSPCEFFYEGTCCPKRIMVIHAINVPELKEVIQSENAAIPGEMFESVMKNFRDVLQECIKFDGRHLS